LRLHDEANGYRPNLDGEAIRAWIEWEDEATKWGIDVEIACADLEALVERNTAEIEREKHRAIHGDDWARWGSRGGTETLRRYGVQWFTMLALRRWGSISAADLEAARPVR